MSEKTSKQSVCGNTVTVQESESGPVRWYWKTYDFAELRELFGAEGIIPALLDEIERLRRLPISAPPTEGSVYVSTIKWPAPPYKLLGDSGQIYCPMCDGEGRVAPPSEVAAYGSSDETSAPTDERAWLIEFTPFPEPLYLAADGTFDRDHLKAVRFSRKQDGEAMLAYMHRFRTDHGYGADPRYTRILHGEDCYRVTEHMWCSPVKASNPP